MGPIWGRQGPGGPYVDPMNFAIWDHVDSKKWARFGMKFDMNTTFQLIKYRLFNSSQTLLQNKLSNFLLSLSIWILETMNNISKIEHCGSFIP